MSNYQHDYAIRFTTDTGIFTISGITFDDAIERANSAATAWNIEGYRYIRHYGCYIHFDAVQRRQIEVISPDGSVYNA